VIEARLLVDEGVTRLQVVSDRQLIRGVVLHVVLIELDVVILEREGHQALLVDLEHLGDVVPPHLVDLHCTNLGADEQAGDDLLESLEKLTFHEFISDILISLDPLLELLLALLLLLEDGNGSRLIGWHIS